jgi:hypothetical protein
LSCSILVSGSRFYSGRPIGWEQVRRVNYSWQAVASDIHGSHKVESQQGKIGKVVLSEAFAGKVGVQAAQSSKAPFADANALEVRQNDAPGVADHDVFDVALSVYENSDLSINLVREFGQLPREFLRDNLPWRYAPFV